MSQFIETEAAEAKDIQRTKFTTKDRQWDCRFNSPTTETDAAIVEAARLNAGNGRLRVRIATHYSLCLR